MKTKMKINILPGCILAASMLLTASCSDFLTEDPKGRLTNENFFQSEEDLDMSVYALYQAVQGYQANSNTMILQCQGDDVTSTTGSNKAAYLSADAFEAPSDLKGVNELWSWYYTLVKRSNLVIDNAGRVNTTDDVRNVALGQAYFWRAYAYYGLVRLWGPVPVVTHNIPDNNETQLSSVEDVYNQIVSDLTAAEACNLPAVYTGANKSINGMNIYVSSQAVKSTLASVYLSMAGYPLNKSEYYAKAADKAEEVIKAVNSNGSQTLLSDWNNVYAYGLTNNEDILSIFYNSSYGSWGWDDSQLTSCHVMQSMPGGWGDFLAERRFWANYPDGPRKDAVYSKTLRTNNGNNVDWWATVDGKAYNGIKGDGSNAVIRDYRPMFNGFSVNIDDNGSPIKGAYDCTKRIYEGMTIDKHHQLIRYSEVICWYAEAAAKAGKDLTLAKSEFKKVRARAWADQAAVNAVDAMSADQLAEAAFQEHGYEVAGNVLGMVTRREDEFRHNILKDQYDYRKGNQTQVLVKKGTLTHSEDATGKPFTYELPEDLVLKEEMPVTAAWNGESSIYSIYPPTEAERNPNIHR